jgi:hypothetical protein
LIMMSLRVSGAAGAGAGAATVDAI